MSKYRLFVDSGKIELAYDSIVPADNILVLGIPDSWNTKTYTNDNFPSMITIPPNCTKDTPIYIEVPNDKICSLLLIAPGGDAVVDTTTHQLIKGGGGGGWSFIFDIKYTFAMSEYNKIIVESGDALGKGGNVTVQRNTDKYIFDSTFTIGNTIIGAAGTDGVTSDQDRNYINNIFWNNADGIWRPILNTLYINKDNGTQLGYGAGGAASGGGGAVFDRTDLLPVIGGGTNTGKSGMLYIYIQERNVSSALLKNVSIEYSPTSFILTPPIASSDEWIYYKNDGYPTSTTDIITITGNTAQISNVGETTLVVSRVYPPAIISSSLRITKANPISASYVLANKKFGDPPFVLPYPTIPDVETVPNLWKFTSSNPKIVSISGSKATIRAKGSVTISATLKEQPLYYSATITAQMNVTPAVPKLSWIKQLVKKSNAKPFDLSTPASKSSGKFSYKSSNTKLASIKNSTVTIHGKGEVTITAKQAAAGNYSTASITVTLTIQ